MNNDQPLVSIVIPTRNRSRQLSTLIKSLLNSSYKNKEIIIINNGDPLSTFIIKGLKIIQNKSNVGLALARNQGAEIARGEYVLFIDDDNVVTKDMLEVLVHVLKSSKNIVGVGPVTYYKSSKNKLWFVGSSYSLTTSKPIFFTGKEVNRLKDRLFLTDILHNCFMIRRSVGEKVKWFDAKIFMSGTEFDMLQRITKISPNAMFVTALDAKDYHDVPPFSFSSLRSLGFENRRRAFYFQRNRGVFVKRYGNIIQQILMFFIFYPLSFLFYLTLFATHKRIDLIIEHIKGTLAGYYYMFATL